MDQITFNQYMNDFFQNKFNQLSYSNTRYPKRMEKITLSLATAPTQPIKISVPFKSCLVSRIYSTAVPTTDKAGSVKILFDYDNLMNIQNAVSLFVNDSFVMDTEASAGFLTWDAQADTTIEIYFFVDIDYRAGTTKTQIVGTVSVKPLSLAIPTSILNYVQTAVGNQSYTVPAGYYARVSFSIICTDSGIAHTEINATVFNKAFASTNNYVASNTAPIIVPTGTILKIVVDAAANASVAMAIELYAIPA